MSQVKERYTHEDLVKRLVPTGVYCTPRSYKGFTLYPSRLYLSNLRKCVTEVRVLYIIFTGC